MAHPDPAAVQTPLEGHIECFGIRYAYQDWSVPKQEAAPSAQKPLVIALHGWLDNCASFHRLAPLLSTHLDIIAIDIIGHGNSQWLPIGRTYQFLEMVSDLIHLIERLSERHAGRNNGISNATNPVILLGHSMGGALCTTAAAACPDQVAACLTIDALGPFFAADQSVVAHFSKAVKHRSKQFQKMIVQKPRFIYPTKQAAVAARVSGGWPINPECADIICRRGLKQVKGGFNWVTDPRLLSPSFSQLSFEQCMQFLKAIECPVFCVEANEGLLNPTHKSSTFQALDNRKACIKQLTCKSFPGLHHLHLEESAHDIAQWLLHSLSESDLLI